jgi:hypothetical protein
MFTLSSKSDSGRNALPEGWLGRRARRLKPAADVNLGMGFTTVMPGPRSVGHLGAPPVNGKAGLSAVNDEPVDGITGHDATDFAPEFLYRCHAPAPRSYSTTLVRVSYRRIGVVPL